LKKRNKGVKPKKTIRDQKEGQGEQNCAGNQGRKGREGKPHEALVLDANEGRSEVKKGVKSQ